jgi:hypothetical protein
VSLAQILRKETAAIAQFYRDFFIAADIHPSTTMKTPLRTLAFAACLALSLGGTMSTFAQDPQAGGRRGGGFGRGPGFDSLSQEEKDKLKAASEKAQNDAKVKETREKMEASMKEYREAMQAAQIAADPSVEPILKKLQEAREKAQKEGGARRGGDAAK